MKQFIAVFFVHTSSGLPVAVWMMHIPHRSPVGASILVNNLLTSFP